ncbi:hypothetical protein [Methylovulum psychrotolerans]|jgi:hypothetical protein|uniref:Uncharacterized protein n=1 Tax=Methylovulum psychrotolerans TaxID=1704499 RepID=A0A1Z4C2E8_9GAMM|nr:hypothetical protein [Methylovulum psychrotolerans]ASF47690.1 hypothetical protein CEK71_17350 [Methylovulum psychrotolerans]MBT9099970.1 hypothetical protein [Methylovulum psychrotolerans]POZ53055.1 hypothetical protein AADEFJLK_00064 [Methylovulum psychrotolerans]
MGYWQKRLREPSTWLGLMQVMIAFALVKFSPEQEQAVTSLIYVFFGTGAVGMAAPDRQHGE